MNVPAGPGGGQQGNMCSSGPGWGVKVPAAPRLLACWLSEAWGRACPRAEPLPPLALPHPPISWLGRPRLASYVGVCVGLEPLTALRFRLS